MRAKLATLLFCLVALTLSCHAEAHPLRYARHAHHRAPAFARGLGFGLIHMVRSARHHPVRPIAHRYAVRRVRRFAQPRMEAALLPFEPGPFSALFGAGQTVVEDGVSAGVAVIGGGGALASNAAVTAVALAIEPVRRFANDPRPAAWCGWYMRQLKGVADRAFNRAAEWARYGQRAAGPAPGVIVVWRHHVGEIVGYAGRGEWLVHSGNDGHAVRTRARSLVGAIAFRE